VGQGQFFCFATEKSFASKERAMLKFLYFARLLSRVHAMDLIYNAFDFFENNVLAQKLLLFVILFSTFVLLCFPNGLLPQPHLLKHTKPKK